MKFKLSTFAAVALNIWLSTFAALGQMPPKALAIARTNRPPEMRTISNSWISVIGETYRLAIGTNTLGRYQYYTNTASTNTATRVLKANGYNIAVAGVYVVSNRNGKALNPPQTNYAWSKEIIFYVSKTNITTVTLGSPTAAAADRTNFTFITPLDETAPPILFTRGVATLTNGAWQGRLQDSTALNPSKWIDRKDSSVVAGSNIVLTAMIQNTPTPAKGAMALVTPITYIQANYLKLFSVTISGWTQKESSVLTGNITFQTN